MWLRVRGVAEMCSLMRLSTYKDVSEWLQLWTFNGDEGDASAPSNSLP